jgi:hypothetical protein
MPKEKDVEMQNELTRIQKKEHEERIKACREKVVADREAARAQELDKALKKEYHKDSRGETISNWAEAMHEADRLINSEINTTQDWRACMIGLLNMFSKLVTALDATINRKTVPYLYPAKAAIVDKFFGEKVLDKIVDGYKKLGNPEITLASLEHNVHFTDDNRLKIDPLLRSDGAQKKGDLDKFFEKGILKWLAEEGYTPVSTDPNSADKDKFVDVHGKILDKVGFEQLKDDPDSGLSHFLSETSDLSFTQSGPKP